MRRAAALIVGAGPAGCAAGLMLARAGAAHVVVERARETLDALCGGFLSWRTLAQLEALGVEADALNRRKVTRVRLFAGAMRAEAALPAPGLAVSRRRLDEALQARLAGVERGVAVRAIERLDARADGVTIAADALFLASGKHDVRGVARPAGAKGSDPALGLRVRLPASAAIERLVGDAVELHLFDRGYAGLAIQEDGSANLCMAVHRSRLAEAGSPAALIAELGRGTPLGERLCDWDADLPVDAVANVPYGWRAMDGAAGLFRLGDQAGVIPSLAGEGIGIAIASGRGAAAAYLRDGPGGAAAWQRRFERSLARPIGVAGAVRWLAEGPLRVPAVRLARWPGLIQVIAALTRVGQGAA